MFRPVTAEEQGYQTISDLQLKEILSGTFHQVQKTHIPVNKLMQPANDGTIDSSTLHNIYECGYILTASLEDMLALEKKLEENSRQVSQRRNCFG